MINESSSKQDEHQAYSTIACGSLDPEEWTRLQVFENRNHLQDPTREEIKDIIIDKECKHPFQRSLIRVDSDASTGLLK